MIINQVIYKRYKSINVNLDQEAYFSPVFTECQKL